jgi:hypothetical protein
MLLEDLEDQMEVTPEALVRSKQGFHEFAAGVIDGTDQMHPRSSPLEPVMRIAIGLEYHPFRGSSFPAASVYDARAAFCGSFYHV